MRDPVSVLGRLFRRASRAAVEVQPAPVAARPEPPPAPPGALNLYERATDERFSGRAYLAANPDLDAGIDPMAHFRSLGRAEGRLQVNPDILDPDSPYRRRKYARFAPLLARAVEGRTFPLALGTQPFDLSQYRTESANPGFHPFVAELQANPDSNYLDLGCGLRSVVFENCLYLEVYPSITADVIVDPDCTYPIRSGSLDGIACLAVLEHTVRPWQVVDEMARMLKPGGKVFIDWPFLQPVHGYPSHYYNATREGLTSLFGERFDIEEAATFPNQTPDHTIAWILGKFVHDLPDAKRDRILGMSVAEFIGHPPGDEFWRSILADLPDETIAEFACGNSLIAAKRA